MCILIYSVNDYIGLKRLVCTYDHICYQRNNSEYCMP